MADNELVNWLWERTTEDLEVAVTEQEKGVAVFKRAMILKYLGAVRTLRLNPKDESLRGFADAMSQVVLGLVLFYADCDGCKDEWKKSAESICGI